MAKAPRAQAIDPEAQYRIKLNRVVQIGTTVLKPKDDNIVKGKRLAELGEAVTSYQKV
ncbi:hypothetical protein [Hyphomicrobium sulfonivorans]|uniref:hypothetical protein n=1 Tax=Hyphomicrobium sulfonivorans TaxID=121290 RepID=UPI00156E5BB9|nr:hypothetical protein [Hyphomicrobium sulfonivorans]MBI1649880.1 hypothetical protein [Hyphomicrobium sulfonivorans]